MKTKSYSVKELSKLSGVTIRTLHYYDKIGLLRPNTRTDAGYRRYAESELLRLQQILFYRELDFPLKEISALLDNPNFKLIEALENHKSALKIRGNRIAELLKTIDTTIDHLKNKETMLKPESLYKGLPKEFGTTLRKEAIESFGREAVEHSEKELLKLGEQDFQKLRSDLNEVFEQLFNLRNEPPEHSDVQKCIARHYQLIRALWGTTNANDNQADAYNGLGQLYIDDPRYTAIDGKHHPGYASFLKKAMGHFVATKLK